MLGYRDKLPIDVKDDSTFLGKKGEVNMPK